MTRLVVAEHTSVKAAHKRFLIDVWHDSAWINGVIGVIFAAIIMIMREATRVSQEQRIMSWSCLAYGPVCLMRRTKLTTALLIVARPTLGTLGKQG